jgi:hypothetical protein
MTGSNFQKNYAARGTEGAAARASNSRTSLSVV